VKIGRHEIGAGRCYVIAEAGVNHDGDLGRARELVAAAAAAGADAVKFQLFRARDIAASGAPKAGYQLRTTDPGESQVEMLAKLELDAEAMGELAHAAHAGGIDFLCTCYAEEELDSVAGLGAPAFKFASAQIVELPLIAHAASKGRPLLLSTGMATLAEIEDALAVAGPEVVLLQCTTNYPAAIGDANLRAIPELAARFRLPIGYSDHTVGSTSAVAAVALGASVLEKHLTLDRTASGPDHASSAEPEELRELVERVREAERALGSATKEPSPAERENVTRMRRSLYAARDVRAGTALAREDVAFKRPAVGLPPARLEDVVGAVARVDIAADTPLTAQLLDLG
jgi:N,N'-diacetyllegionaminate synthase